MPALLWWIACLAIFGGLAKLSWDTPSIPTQEDDVDDWSDSA